MKGFTLFLIATVWAVSATAADRRVANVPADLAVFENFGSHRLLAFQVCSPEHCWHEVFVQALTNHSPGKVLCTAPIVEFNESSDVIVKSARQSENQAAVLNLQLISSHDAFEPYRATLTMQKECGYRLDPATPKVGTLAHAGTPSDDVGSFRITMALDQGVDMFQLLKRIDAKDAGELKRELESQGDTDDVTLAQIRLASDMPHSECRIGLMDDIERRRVERGLIASAADEGDWVVARAVANMSLRVALDTIDRAEPSAMTPQMRELADRLKRLVGKWESGYYSL